MTSALTLQLLPAVAVPPERLIAPLPAFAVTVPPQVLAILAGVATTMPAGKLSVKARAVASTGLALLSMAKASVTGEPADAVADAKLLPNCGGTVTFSVSVAVPLSPRSDVRLPDTFT